MSGAPETALANTIQTWKSTQASNTGHEKVCNFLNTYLGMEFSKFPSRGYPHDAEFKLTTMMQSLGTNLKDRLDIISDSGTP
jgi:hypothetical protein